MNVRSVPYTGEELKEKYVRGEMTDEDMNRDAVQALYDYEWKNIESGLTDDMEVIDFCIDYFMACEDYIKPEAEYHILEERIMNGIDSFYNIKQVNKRRTKTFRLSVGMCAVLIIILSIQTISIAYGKNFIRIALLRSEELLTYIFYGNQSAGNDVYLSLEPGWIPEGYTIKENIENNTDSSTLIGYIFTNDEDEIFSIYIEIWNDGESGFVFYEIDNKYVNEFIYYGISHYIESNNGILTATWQCENRNYIISGNLNKEEIKKIIISFYGG